MTGRQEIIYLHERLFRMQKEAQHNGVSPHTLEGYVETRNAANAALSNAVESGTFDFEKFSQHMTTLRQDVFSDGREPDTNDEGSDN